MVFHSADLLIAPMLHLPVFFVALNSKTLALTPPRLWALISDPSGNLNRRT
jgi:hypothetical protein